LTPEAQSFLRYQQTLYRIESEYNLPKELMTELGRDQDRKLALLDLEVFQD
jgi:hypothetical protein